MADVVAQGVQNNNKVKAFIKLGPYPKDNESSATSEYKSIKVKKLPKHGGIIFGINFRNGSVSGELVKFLEELKVCKEKPRFISVFAIGKDVKSFEASFMNAYLPLMHKGYIFLGCPLANKGKNCALGSTYMIQKDKHLPENIMESCFHQGDYVGQMVYHTGRTRLKPSPKPKLHTGSSSESEEPSDEPGKSSQSEEEPMVITPSSEETSKEEESGSKKSSSTSSVSG
eukprot:TRINITY_DN10769_c0_g1_i1.p1 TRINITY_DN10769_c0_g1~~TRINITY_DN10769_c0_g1_i1.p1  ORF type:complete len:228 (+),score=46.36 TRINITY_DN10769_c0_g1_i1:112-795(+)